MELRSSYKGFDFDFVIILGCIFICLYNLFIPLVLC
jgi:hypothetical protein